MRIEALGCKALIVGVQNGQNFKEHPQSMLVVREEPIHFV
jgi:hypothetical protein